MKPVYSKHLSEHLLFYSELAGVLIRQVKWTMMSDFWSSELAGVEIRQIRWTKICDTVYSSLTLLRPSFLQWKYGLVRGVGSLVVQLKSGFIAHWLEWPYKRIPIELESNLKFYLHKLWIIYAGFSFNRFPCILLLSLFFVHN